MACVQVFRHLPGRTAVHCNDIVALTRPLATRHLLFFPGDISHERAQMVTGPYEKFAAYSIEGMLDLLGMSFPDANCFIVIPEFQLPSGHSMYTNFLSHDDEYGCLLLTQDQNNRLGVEEPTARAQIPGLLQSLRTELSTQHSITLRELPWVLMGFSKGCLVLNHLLLEEGTMEDRSDLLAPADSLFSISGVERLVWVDAGNSDLQCSYPGARTADHVNAFVKQWTASGSLRHIDIHTTPYMVDLRPLLRKEVEEFNATLLTHKTLAVSWTNHLSLQPCLEEHFDVLKLVR